jgi:hypothetical protein
MQQRNEDDASFDWLIFDDQSNLQVSGKVNKDNVRIWGTENPKDMFEHKRDSPKLNVLCAASRRKVYRTLFFSREHND